MKCESCYSVEQGPGSSPKYVLFRLDGKPMTTKACQWDRDEPDYVVDITTEFSGNLTRLGPGRLVVMRTGDHTTTVARVVAKKPNTADPTACAVGGMFSGDWLYSSDSRWPFETPVPVHDRYEG